MKFFPILVLGLCTTVFSQGTGQSSSAPGLLTPLNELRKAAGVGTIQVFIPGPGDQPRLKALVPIFPGDPQELAVLAALVFWESKDRGILVDAGYTRGQLHVTTKGSQAEVFLYLQGGSGVGTAGLPVWGTPMEKLGILGFYGTWPGGRSAYLLPPTLHSPLPGQMPTRLLGITRGRRDVLGGLVYRFSKEQAQVLQGNLEKALGAPGAPFRESVPGDTEPATVMRWAVSGGVWKLFRAETATWIEFQEVP